MTSQLLGFLAFRVHGGSTFTTATFIFFACWFGFFSLMAWLYLRRVQRLLRTSFSDASSQLGLDFRDSWPQEGLARFWDFSLFQQERMAKAEYVGESRKPGDAAMLMILSFVAGSGRSRTVFEHSAVFFPEPISNLPDFTLGPDTLAKQVERKFKARQNIRFDDSDTGTRFSKQYEVLGDDDTVIRHVLGTRLVEHLADQPGWFVEARSGQVLVWKPKWWSFLIWIKPAAAFIAFFEEAKSIRSMLS